MRLPVTKSRPRIVGMGVALAMVCIVWAATSPLPVRRMAFSAPAAYLAGLLSGAPCVKDGDDFRLLGSDLDLTVVPACAAVDYFCLMTGFLSLLLTWRGLNSRAHLFVMPAAWILTILINALRLIACWQTDRLAQAFLPQSVWPATHMVVGIVTFLTGLTFIFWLMTLKTRKDTTYEYITRGSD